MKVLLCTDGSRNGLSAVKLGAIVAAWSQAETTLLCVVDKSASEQEATRLLRLANNTAQKTGASVATYIGHRGELVDEMLTQMLQVEYDFVTVGYEARSFLEKMIWGSTASRIADELPVSVLIIREPRDWIDHILIGISGGGFTTACTGWGGQVAAAFDAQVTLLHVGATPPLMYAGLEEVIESLDELLGTDTAEAQAIREATACLDELGIRTQVELVHGLPERELLRVAQEQEVDLLVVGSAWAAQRVRRIFFRNVTEKILLNTQRPVLVIRPD
jgi:nucleotide-binding universal stress UspA family protein